MTFTLGRFLSSKIKLVVWARYTHLKMGRMKHTLVGRSDLNWELFQMSTRTTGEMDRLAPVLAISERFHLKSNEMRVWF